MLLTKCVKLGNNFLKNNFYVNRSSNTITQDKIDVLSIGVFTNKLNDPDTFHEVF